MTRKKRKKRSWNNVTSTNLMLVSANWVPILQQSIYRPGSGFDVPITATNVSCAPDLCLPNTPDSACITFFNETNDSTDGYAVADIVKKIFDCNLAKNAFKNNRAGGVDNDLLKSGVLIRDKLWYKFSYLNHVFIYPHYNILQNSLNDDIHQLIETAANYQNNYLVLVLDRNNSSFKTLVQNFNLIGFENVKVSQLQDLIEHPYQLNSKNFYMTYNLKDNDTDSDEDDIDTEDDLIEF